MLKDSAQNAAATVVYSWLVVRGISDDASPGKNDAYHHLAARNAALVLRELAPYLPITRSGMRAG